MRVKFCKVRPHHLREIEIQPAEEWATPFLQASSSIIALFDYKLFSATAYDADTGSILCVGGITADGVAWTILSKKIGTGMRPLLTFIKTMMLQYSLTRGPVYATIDETRPESIRWARLLGFAPTQERSQWVYSFTRP